MSKVLVDRELLERTVKHLEWDGDGSQTVMQYAQQGDSLAGELEEALAQPAEAKGVDEFDARCLDKWLRQYCHNDGSPGFVFGYEAKGTEQLVDRLRAALSAVTAERDALLAEREGKVQMPLEPTGSIVAAMKRELDKSPVTWCRYRAAYRAALAAKEA